MMEETTINSNDFNKLQDYKYLRQFGMELIQELSGSAWTNLNHSDPGVTILEQVVYAMTELGYCSSFPIEDILTEEDNKIRYTNQFYKADELFNKTPIAVSEYKTYIKTISQSILAVGCKTFNSSKDFVNGAYSFYLCLMSDQKDSDNLALEVYFELNKIRGLCEIFVLPTIVHTTGYTIQGTLVLKYNKAGERLIGDISNAISKFIAQKWEDYFDNGELKNEGESLRINAYDFGQCVADINNISALRDVAIIKPDGTREDYLSINVNSFGFIDIAKSVQSGTLQVVYENTEVILNDDWNSGDTNSIAKGPAERNELHGSYRDIADYFSIQETFPALYKVGTHSAEDSKNNYETALSRQFRGYLLMIDQIMSNQFAQLSHISDLFSFNAINTANYSVQKEYSIGVSDKDYIQYPAPELYFTPTYFYNTLYQVPCVMPLLLHNSIFENDNSNVDSSLTRKRAFEEYKADPYNPYNKALLSASATDKNNFERKNEILNHLLARHGISPDVIDNLCKGAYYTGVNIQDRLLTKSSLLINFIQLSSRRNCGYNFLAATSIPNPIQSDLDSNIQEPHEKWVIDTVLDPYSIYKQLNVSQQDNINYSAFELLGWQLLGLKPAYEYAIFELGNKDTNIHDQEKIRQLNWFCTERKGFMLIESILLRSMAMYRICLSYNNSTKPDFRIDPELTFEELVAFKGYEQNSNGWLETIENSGWFQLGNKKFIVQPLIERNKKLSNENKDKIIKYNVTALYGDLEIPDLEISDPGQTVFLILPGYVPLLNCNEFIGKIETFISEYLPIHITPKLIYLSQGEIELFIPLYTEWHNLLRWRADSNLNDPNLHLAGGRLYAQLLKISQHV